MATQPSPTMAALMAEPAQEQFGFALGQLPNVQGIASNAEGTLATTQLMLGDVLSYRISRSQTQSSDTCTLTFADDLAQRMSTNKAKSGIRGQFFYPGPIQKLVEFYVGYRGCINSGKSNFSPYAQAATLAFTGFVETDANAQAFGTLDKTVTLNDLTSQFKFQVYDTFPHALYGNQTLPYFDPNYNLYPIPNPNNGNTIDGVVWQCDGRMFTMTGNDPVWGATNMPVTVFIDITGGHNLQTIAFGGGGNYVNIPTFPNTVGTDQRGFFTFDFSNGIITLTNAGLNQLSSPGGLPLNSVLSLRGNPTYMAPEVMIRKLLVEKAGWNPNQYDLQTTNVLLPMFDGQDRSIWDCMTAIAGMTNPRFMPWQLWCDEAGVIHFYEQNLDSPPKRYWINGENVVTADHEYTARDVRTVVRGDATVAIAGSNGYDSGSDQAITAIAYDNRSIVEYGLTEPMLLTQDVTDSVRHLTPTQAVAHLNLMAQSVLYQMSRPVYTITVDHLPDYFVQIGDKVRMVDASIGVDSEFQITAIERSSDGKVASQQTTLQEYYETINFNLGIPAGVSDEPTGHGATQAPPNSAIIGAVRMGTNAPMYVFKNGDYSRDINNNPIVANWNANDENGMYFDYLLWPKGKAEGGGVQEWSYYRRPPVTGGNWQLGVDPSLPNWYYIEHATGQGGNGNTYAVGPDSVFYQYNNGPNPPNANPGSPPAYGGGGGTHWPLQEADYPYLWTPPGNTDPIGDGKPGTAYTAFVWAWWYLCLDSNIVDPSTGDPYYTEPFKEKDGRLMFRFVQGQGLGTINHQDAAPVTVPSGNGTWVRNIWNLYPGTVPGSSGVNKSYKNLVIGCNDYTTTPPGFVGANVMADGVHVGVAYGPDVSSSAQYVNYQKQTKGHFCLFAMDNKGGSQFLRIPFWLNL